MKKPTTVDASVPSDGFGGAGGAAAGGAASTCNPAFCQSNGTYKGCCTSSGVCGAEFGANVCLVVPPDAGLGGAGGRRGTGGRPPTAEDAGNDAEEPSAGGRGGAGTGGHATGGRPPAEPDASVDASAD